MYNNLNFDSELSSFFEESHALSKVVQLVNNDSDYLKHNGDYLKVESCDTISYIPKSKLSLEHSKFEDTKYRTKIKIGRFITKFIDSRGLVENDISTKDVEIFVNLFKSFFDRDMTKLKVVSGDEILHYYLDDNYHRPGGSSEIGSLWKSCMRFEKKNRYMRIYSKNPDKIKMLILVDDSNNVKARALLWEDCEDGFGNKYKVMDRIYSVYDHDVVFFKSWATKNGYLYKYEQSAYNESQFVDCLGAVVKLRLTIKLDNHSCSYYPYIDTFKYYSDYRGTLSNCTSFSYSYTLIQNDGSLETESDEEEEPEIEENW